MTIHASGSPISMSEINAELGRAADAAINLNESEVRSLLGKPTANSAISLSDAYGKSKYTAGAVQYSTPGTTYFNPTASTIYATVIAGGGAGHYPNSDYYGAGGGGSGGWYYAHAISGLTYGETCTAVVGAGGAASGGVGGTSALYTSTHGLVLAPTGGAPHSVNRSAAGPGGSPNGQASGAGTRSGNYGISGKGGDCTCPTYGGAGGAAVTATSGPVVGNAGGVGAGGSGGAGARNLFGGNPAGGAGGAGFIRVTW